jgi:thiol-disulfide isomerase/thioredoxin
MAILTAAIIFIGLLCFLDLLLSFAIIRRLRQGTPESGSLSQLPGLAADSGGRPIPPFNATTITGTELSQAGLAGRPAAFAFFASECHSCRDHLAQFAGYARSFPGGASQVAVIIAGSAEGAADIVAALTGLAQLVIEPDFGPVATAFSVRAFPTFVILDPNGRIDGAAWAIQDLPVPQTA